MRSLLTRQLNRRISLLLASGLLAPALVAQNRQIELEWLRTAGQTIAGTTDADQSGTAVACAGDVNGDGFDDVIIGAPLATRNTVVECGEAYLVYGGPGQSGNKSLTNADITFTGNISPGHTGAAVAAAGDVNKDGFDDVLIGAPNEKPHGTGSGQAYLVYGGASLPSTISLTALGSGGVTFNGQGTSDLAGCSVAGLGDVNGDTFRDIAVGAKGETGGAAFAGATYIVYGGAAMPSVVELSTLTVSTGCWIKGIGAVDNSGDQIAGPGDVNGDGKADLLIAARFADAPGKVNAGQCYLVYGSASLPAFINLSSLGAAGVTFSGAVASDELGGAVAGAGDVNNDGKDDLLMSSTVADPPGKTDAGRVYLVFGSASLPSAVAMGSLGALGVVFDGRAANYGVGNALGGGGDVNRDGIDDFLIGDELAPPGGGGASGEVYLIYGASSGWGTTFDLNAINQRGVVLNGVDTLDDAGHAVAVGGDINDDGFADVVIGAFRGDAGGTDAGETVVLYGAPHFLQAAGPTALGGSLVLRAHGAASQPMEMMYSPFVLPAVLNTGLGPFWLGSPYFEVGLGSFGSNGEYLASFPLPSSPGLLGVTIYIQFLGKKQGLHNDLTALLAVTLE